MNPRDFQFFLTCFALLFGSWAPQVNGQAPISSAIGAEIDGANGSRRESPLYREAVRKFGQPSIIRLSDSQPSSLETWDRPGEIMERAVVLDWTDRELQIVRPDSVDRTILPNPRVLSLQVAWHDPAADQLLVDLNQRKYSDVVTAGSKLLASKDAGSSLPRWQQKVVISALVEASMGMDRWERAALLYASLAKSQSPPLLLAGIPIPWTQSSATIGDRQKMHEHARNWIVDSNENLQLLGASWLLDTSSREEATTVLTKLSRQASGGWVRQYATAQLWRTMASSQIDSSTLVFWTKTRDSLLLPLQAGPTFLMGEKLSDSTHAMRGSEEWLRILLLHKERPFLYDQAKQRVIPLLQSLGDAKSVDLVQRLAD